MTCPDCPESTGTYAVEETYHGIDTTTINVTVYCRGCDAELHTETETRRAKHRLY
ncbi:MULTISPECIES: hypothetical protein [unclassified Haloarcula]|uniref:hypothetical protein n=1 Tax=unclassified Haloarcula TaxID=2624677 RepID=UPI001314996D|nr:MULTISPECIES: hypothetical protein [unclassified Haloarcula]